MTLTCYIFLSHSSVYMTNVWFAQLIRWQEDLANFERLGVHKYTKESLVCKGFLREDLDMNNEEHVKLMWAMGSEANLQAGMFCAETIGDKITCIQRVRTGKG